MIDSKKIEDLITEFDVAIIKAEGSETIEEAVKWLEGARHCITELEKVIPEIKQEELDSFFKRLISFLHDRRINSEKFKQ